MSDIVLTDGFTVRWKWVVIGLRAASILLLLLAITHLGDLSYWAKRLAFSDAEIADMQATELMLKHLTVVQVACPSPSMTPDQQQRWLAYAAQKGYTPYPQAGTGCYDP